MNELPLISVVMACYKEPKEILKRSIDSILNQTFRNFEFIIVLDDPENHSAIELLEEYCQNDQRIRYFINQMNMRQGYSRNLAIKNSIGYYIAVQDGDDESMPERLEIQYDFMKNNPDVDLCASGIRYLTFNKKILIDRKYKNEIEKVIKRYCPIASATILAKKIIFEKFGYYDDSIKTKYVEDYDLWIRFYLDNMKISNIDDILYLYYQSDNNIKGGNTKKQLKQTIKLKLRYRKRLKFSLGDYVYILAELMLLLIPPSLIRTLFYLKYKT
jgi:glycosyltransferase involved in cell wall biosynthesis